MKKTTFAKELLNVGLFVVVLGLAPIAKASDGATNALLSACMSKDVRIQICEVAQDTSRQIEVATERLIKEVGVDPTYGVLVASSTQMIAQGRLNVDTSVYGVKSRFQVSPKALNVAFSFEF